MNDLISRQAVVKVIKEFFKTKVDEIPKRTKFEKLCDLCELYLELNAELHKEIDAMPTAYDVGEVVEQQLNNGWIPVSERLPEVDKYGEAYVLVSMDDEFIATTTYVKDEGFELWAESGEVVAWQPLPQPYKEVSE